MRAIDRTGAAFNSVDRRMRALSQVATFATRSIGGLAAAFGVREIAQAADRYKILENRLKLVTDSAEELASVQQDLFDLAQDTRSALEPTVELYSRMARATEELGLGQAKTIELTRAINQAIQVSGATSEEASAGVIQFAQGLASGALRGDELRSVLEQMPRLARALADGMGITIGQLREAGAAGELTSAAIIRAIQSQADVLQSEFAQTEGTVGQAVTGLGNSMLVLVGKIDEATGSSNLLADALNLVSGAVDALSGSADTSAQQVNSLLISIRATEAYIARNEQASQSDSWFTRTFGTDTEAQIEGARRRLEGLYSQLNALQNPLEEIRVKFKQIDPREALLAPVSVDASKIFVPPELGDVGEAEAARQARVRAALETELETVRQHSLTRAQVEIEATQNRMEILRNALDTGLIDQQRYAELAVQVARQSSEELSRIELAGLTERERWQRLSARKKTQIVLGELAQMTAGTAQHSRTMFELNKALAYANAIVNTHEAVTAVLADKSLPTPARFALAAVAAAKGLAEVAAIKSTTFEGGGQGTTPSAIGGSGGVINGQPVSQLSSPEREDREPTVIVNFHGLTGAEINDRTAMLIGDALNRVIKERRYEIRGN